MDITKDNFASSMDRICAAISRCSFLAMDCEFSGLSTGGSTCQYDSPEERYTHLRRTASGFLVIQFGLAAFTLEKERNRYTQETFNFYLFPRHPHQGAFLCQPSSLEFLLDNGFDFNKLIRDGIGYLRPAQVEALREHLEQQLQESDPSAPASAQSAEPTPVPDNQADFVNRAMSEIEKFLETSEEHIDFQNLSPFQRKLLYDHVPVRITTPLDLETVRPPGCLSGSSQRSLRVCRALSAEERRERARRRVKGRVEEAAGFSRVVQAVSQAGKPVVGHNMLLDLIHIVEQFICPLPETFADFKSVVHGVFPTLVDTKVMGSTQPFRDLLPSTGLGEMADCLAVHPFTMPEIVAAEDSGGPEYDLKDSKHHEAGYDAFLTASCFAAMVSYLGLLLKPPVPVPDPTADIVRPFANKIFAMRMADLPYLNLTGPDLTPTRDHVFHLTFPASWRTADIVQLFSPFSRVQVAWLDDTSAFISLERRDQASQVLQNVRAAGTFTLRTYADWQQGQRLSRGSRQRAPSAPSSPAARPPAGPAPSLATPPAPGGAEAANGSGSDSTPEAAAGQSTVSGTKSGHAKSTGKKRKRESSGSSENGVEHQKSSATKSKASKEMFAVPDW